MTLATAHCGERDGGHVEGFEGRPALKPAVPPPNRITRVVSEQRNLPRGSMLHQARSWANDSGGTRKRQGYAGGVIEVFDYERRAKEKR